MEPNRHQEAGKLLADAWRTGALLADLPAELQPKSRAEAFLIQDAFIRLRGPIGAWKVQPFDQDGRNFAPIPAVGVHTSPANVDVGPFVVDLEVEVAVRIAHDLDDPAKTYTTADASAAIGSLHAALEIVGSRYRDRRAVPQLAAVADLMSGSGLVIGEGLSDWRSLELATIDTSLIVDGAKVGAAGGAWSTAEMIETIAALATFAAKRGCGGLKAGHIVLTGARVKPYPVKPGQVEGRVGPFAPVRLTLR